MKITRLFTTEGKDPFRTVEYELYDCLLKHQKTGEVILSLDNCEVPKGWSKNARNTLISKYFRKAGVPTKTLACDTDGVPVWLMPAAADPNAVFGPETSVKQVIHRIVGHLTYTGFVNGYFDPPVDQLPHPVSVGPGVNPDTIIAALRESNARAYFDEMVYMMLHQYGAPNSPQWFNTGLWWAYGINGPAQGHYFVDLAARTNATDPVFDRLRTGDVNQAQHDLADYAVPSPNAYERVQAHACYILGVSDTLLGEGGIIDWVEREARIFKYGSGSGANVSQLRSRNEKLSGGGKSSGVMSFVEAADRFGGVVKSGGTTRRAAKMIVLDIDHPDIEDFVFCKTEAEVAVASMVVGNALVNRHCQQIMNAVKKLVWAKGASVVDALEVAEIRETVEAAQAAGVLDNYIQKAILLAMGGNPTWPNVVLDTDFEGRAYQIAPFQNANHSVRVPSTFYEAVDNEEDWFLTDRTAPDNWTPIPAAYLQKKIAEACWFSGDPGMQYSSTINAWNVTPSDGKIDASNPCQPAAATMLTPQGLRTLGEINEGDTIWSGHQWTRVVKKWSTGVKPVFRYQTTAGYFLGTAEHRVIMDGERIPVGEATAVDIACGERAFALPLAQFNPSDVMDGWVFGDGSVHRASNDLVHLHIGENDGDIHKYLANLVAEYRPGLSPTSWEVQTTLAAGELPLTHQRSVPSRFKFGTATTVRGFLRGLYSANGSVCGGRITLKAASFQVISDVQEMLSSLGIRSYYTSNQSHEVAFDNGTYDCRESYDLNITSDRQAFTQLIGFVQEYKQAKALGAAERPRRNYAKTTYDIVAVKALGDMPVYDLTVEADEHTYWTGGLLVSNCAEHLRLNDSACNLASQRLTAFLRATPTGMYFDVTAFMHSTSLWTMALDITNTMAHLPSAKTAASVYLYRDIGLGYCDLGALLMAFAIPYDSPRGLALAGAITALMQGQSHVTSAMLAGELGAYPRFAANREDHLRCVRNHMKALRAGDGPFEELEVEPYQIDQNALNDALGDNYLDFATTLRQTWDDAYALGQKHGFRNAEMTVIAPTGTIGFVMDCDTTGVEPLYGLQVHKQLVGGNSYDLSAASVKTALEALSYDDDEIKAITAFISQHGTIPTENNRTEPDGYFVDPDHVSVFATAASKDPACPPIAWEGHIKMMAAVQTFISGGISKTVNMPETATVDDVSAAFRLGHDLGLKSVALYRDNSKLSQPLTIKARPKAPAMTVEAVNKAFALTDNTVVAAKLRAAVDGKKISPTPLSEADRVRLGWNRTPGFDVAVKIGAGTLYVRTTRFDNGQPAEIWASYSADQGIIQAFLSNLCRTANIALQYGVPLAAITQSWRESKFEPLGLVYDHPYIKNAKSIVALLARLLDYHELGDTSILTVQPKEEAKPLKFPDPPTKIIPLSNGSTLTVAESTNGKIKAGVTQGHVIITGECCTECGSNRLLPNGAGCKRCADCGTAGGCGP